MGLLREAQQEDAIGRMIINVLGEHYTRYACIHETKAVEAILKCIIKLRGGECLETYSMEGLYSQYREINQVDVSAWRDVILAMTTAKVKAEDSGWHPTIDTFRKLELAYTELLQVIDVDVEYGGTLVLPEKLDSF